MGHAPRAFYPAAQRSTTPARRDEGRGRRDKGGGLCREDGQEQEKRSNRKRVEGREKNRARAGERRRILPAHGPGNAWCLNPRLFPECQAPRDDWATSIFALPRLARFANAAPRAVQCRASHRRGRTTKEPGASRRRAHAHHFATPRTCAVFASSNIAVSGFRCAPRRLPRVATLRADCFLPRARRTYARGGSRGPPFAIRAGRRNGFARAASPKKWAIVTLEERRLSHSPAAREWQSRVV
jgi:hypothetical protein